MCNVNYTIGGNNHLLLKKLHTGTLSDSDILLLSKLCFNIAFEIVCKRYKLLYPKKTIDEVRIELEDVAYQAITNLFVLQSNDRYGIVNALEDKTENIDSEENLHFQLTQIISRLVDQSIIVLLKARDPFFEKILHNMNTCVSKNNFEKISWFGTKYIVQGSEKEIYYPIIDEEEFVILPAHLFVKKQKALLDDIFIYLEEETDYFPAIPYNALIKRLKNIYLEGYAAETDNMELKKLGEIHVLKVTKEALAEIEKNIDQTYVRSGKFSVEEKISIMDGFKDVAEDLRLGGLSAPLFDYFLPYFQTMDKDAFEKKYSRIIYYLYGQMKQLLLEFLEMED